MPRHGSVLLVALGIVGVASQGSLERSQEVDVPSSAFDADETCHGDEGGEECSLSLRQLRQERKATAADLSAVEAAATARGSGEEGLMEEGSSQANWQWGLAHDGKFTGGTCFMHNCESSRGPTKCHHWRCLCEDGYIAAGGKCFPDSMSPKTALGTRRIQDTCGTRGYCDPKLGFATCREGKCFCLEDFVAENGKCKPPSTEGPGGSAPTGPSGEGDTTTAEVPTTLEDVSTTPVPEDPSQDPDCAAPTPDSDCMKKIKWAKSDGIFANPKWYPGLTPQTGDEKFQDTLYRAGEGGCPRPCKNGLPEDPLNFPHTLRTRTTRGIEPPKHPLQYNGIEWPKMQVKGTNTHIFAIGDWGGMPGKLPHNTQIIQYTGGQTRGPHPMGRYRTDAKTHDLSCSTPEMSDCFGTNGTKCPARCGFIKDVDGPAQSLVATQMKRRAPTSKPDFVLNVGDNFYWGGIAGQCGDTPMWKVSDVTNAQFKWIFENIYNGQGLDAVPWLSVFGNHDWGGRQMNAAWDQQIAYTWVSNRWILPAPYWMQTVEYVDQGFTAEIFMLDSNTEDALADTSETPEHNICGALHNPTGASCAKVGGPASIDACHDWFKKLWDDGSEWMVKKLKTSTADWQISVTHFPCGHMAKFWKDAHLKYGLDLLVTGHVHFQMMYWSPEKLGGLTCFITGGGGGITSENNVELSNEKDHQYGFFDLTISKEKIVIESINWKGNIVSTNTTEPYLGTDTKKAEMAPCETPAADSPCDKTTRWAKSDGIHSNPEWFPGLTPDSPLSGFQENFYKDHKNGCGKPCP